MERDPKQQADVKMATNPGRQQGEVVEPVVNPGESKGAEKGAETGNGLEKGINEVKNLGESIRKNINDFADNAIPKKEHSAKSQGNPS